MLSYWTFFLTLFFLLPACLSGQPGPAYLLKPDRVFNGHEMLEDWAVLTEGDQIVAAGPVDKLEPGEQVVHLELNGMTLLPGMIEGHGHLFLYPYNQTGWNDQVLKESQSLRVARATVHAKQTLLAGFTTFRDLGTEGAGYADVGLKQAIQQGIIPGPRLIISTKAIVATGSYGPKGFATDHEMPVGAEVADGYDNLIQVVRNQIGKGADFIKVYADYRWGPSGEAKPTFTLEELKLLVSIANSSGRPVVAHATSTEGMMRAILAGVQTIEHGDGGNAEVFKLMATHGIALCPTLAAGEAITQYQGWQKGSEDEPERIKNKRSGFKMALENQVTICAGGDVGVFPHGDNVRELELMVEYGMSNAAVLAAVTSGNAEIFNLSRQLGSIAPGLQADLIAVKGNPMDDISDLRNVTLVLKAGKIYKQK